MKKLFLLMIMCGGLLSSNLWATDVGIAEVDVTIDSATHNDGTSTAYDTLYFRTDLVPEYSAHWRSYWIKFDTLAGDGPDSNCVNLIFEHSPLAYGAPWKLYDSTEVELSTDSIVEAELPSGGLNALGNFYGVTWNGQYYANMAKRITLDSTACGPYWRVRTKSVLKHLASVGDNHGDLWRTRVAVYLMGHKGD